MPSTQVRPCREVVQLLEAQGVPQAHTHRHVAAALGSATVWTVDHVFRVKRITVKPGGRLSLQMHHHHRAGTGSWCKGTAQVTCGERVFDCRPTNPPSSQRESGIGWKTWAVSRCK